ncbi:hypothetical protein WR25_17682 [Diploscapter pachys]|uniref:C2H2-type domain-containing protein n=1 Tax=Diploscapter pachys TaxID=2018661 RepID=A0A2A2KSG0_9BILA|nr:hypothetical protein WR25_17682 [Diploscapter pachys]
MSRRSERKRTATKHADDEVFYSSSPTKKLSTSAAGGTTSTKKAKGKETKQTKESTEQEAKEELISPPPTTTSTPKRSRASAQKVKEETERTETVGETLMKMKDKEKKEENELPSSPVTSPRRARSAAQKKTEEAAEMGKADEEETPQSKVGPTPAPRRSRSTGQKQGRTANANVAAIQSADATPLQSPTPAKRSRAARSGVQQQPEAQVNEHSDMPVLESMEKPESQPAKRTRQAGQQQRETPIQDQVEKPISPVASPRRARPVVQKPTEEAQAAGAETEQIDVGENVLPQTAPTPAAKRTRSIGHRAMEHAGEQALGDHSILPQPTPAKRHRQLTAPKTESAELHEGDLSLQQAGTPHEDREGSEQRNIAAALDSASKLTKGANRLPMLECGDPQCDVVCDCMATLVEHVAEAHDRSDLTIEDYKFSSWHEFEKWRLEMETETLSKFTRASGRVNRTDVSKYYLCHLSGHTSRLRKRDKSESVPLQRIRPTKKMGRYCTAFMNVKISKADGSVLMKGCLGHFGHTFDVRRLPVPEKTKTEIAELLLRGCNEDEVLTIIRGKSMENERPYYLQRYEVRNVLLKMQREGTIAKTSYDLNEEDWDDPYESPLQRPSEIRPLTLASVLTGKKMEKVDVGSASRKGAGEEATSSQAAANHDDKALTGAIIKTITPKIKIAPPVPETNRFAEANHEGVPAAFQNQASHSSSQVGYEDHLNFMRRQYMGNAAGGGSGRRSSPPGAPGLTVLDYLNSSEFEPSDILHHNVTTEEESGARMPANRAHIQEDDEIDIEDVEEKPGTSMMSHIRPAGVSSAAQIRALAAQAGYGTRLVPLIKEPLPTGNQAIDEVVNTLKARHQTLSQELKMLEADSPVYEEILSQRRIVEGKLAQMVGQTTVPPVENIPHHDMSHPIKTDNGEEYYWVEGEEEFYEGEMVAEEIEVCEVVEE